ncbi:MAG: hypothetical protein E7642_02025 [Ruminococcaceae bacterium]|nr:hypothetical protein [Oscillospiraceae bacterium]
MYAGKRSFLKRILNLFLIIIFVITLLVLTAGVAFGIYAASITEKEIDESVFDVLSSNTASKIYYYRTESDREAGIATELEGQELFGGYRSMPVSYGELSEDIINSFVCIEDKRFFEHNGVDWKRTAGAALNYLLRFRDEFGGSTITQQLIKNITERDEYSLQRKLQEIMWALDLETKMSKEEILENYLNIINLSNGCYGVGAAAEYYFSKKVSELTLIECASIAAITNNPSYYDPIRYPQNNRSRALLILDQMYEQGYIDHDRYTQAKESEIALKIKDGKASNVNLWYVDMVIDDVINALIAEKGYTRQMANMAIYRGGLKIYTAMDLEIQKTLEAYYANERNFRIDGEKTPQSAMIIIDPYSGDVLGVAGAIGEKNANRLQNFATSTVRPAGSVIKPLSVYAPALEKGLICWSSVYDDVPVNFGNGSTPVAWPKNANGVYRGLTNVNYAIANSVNTVTVKVLEELGLEESFDFLYDKLQMKSIIRQKTLPDGSTISDMDYAALALGQFNYGVSVREISAAYSIFVNKGIYSRPRSYYKVLDADGGILLEDRYYGEAVISEDNAIIMTEMLKNVVEEGTATNITLSEKIECAGKTGTTQNNYDKWYIGYTPYYVGGVWYGYEYPESLSSSAGKTSTKIWNEVMTLLHAKYLAKGNVKEFEDSNTVVEAEYCADSGKLASEACKKDVRKSRVEKGYFSIGSEPDEKCDRHVLVSYDRVEGGVAAEGCYGADLELVGLIKAERSFPMQIYVSDAQYVYRELPSDVMPETSPSLPYFNNIFREGEYCGISYGEKQFNRYCRAHFDYWKWKEQTAQ